METIFDSSARVTRVSRAGSSLLIVLAFVVLLTALILAFFSRSILEEQVSNSSANQVKVDNFALGAVSTTLSDLKAEVEAGSGTATFPALPNKYIYYYTPTASSGASYPTMLPSVTGSASGTAPGATFGANSLASGAFANLIKVSLHGTKFFASSSPPYTTLVTDPNRAAAISTGSSGDTTGTMASGSTDGTSLNGRYISGSRWNKPLFLAPGTVFPLPDWVYVERTPTTIVQNATAWNANLIASPVNMTTTTTVLGRYAYAIYDEGGLLDINVAGAPTPLAPAGALGSLGAYKSAEAMADLTQIPGLTQTLADTIVGWRNNASAAQWQGTTVNTPLSGNVTSGYTWSTTNGTNYFYNVLFNPTGFLRPVSTGTTTGTLAQSDQFFTSRQQLLQFFNTVLGGGNTVNGALQYLTHFSRSLEQPSYQPPYSRPKMSLTVATGGNDLGGGTEDNTGSASALGTFTQKTVNPSFLSARATVQYQRADGSIAAIGDPLVKKRFALSRLAWLTFLGPIADDNGLLINNSSCALYVSGNATNANTIINTLETAYGYTPAFLAQGGPTNIQKYFGLVWVQDSSTNIGLNDGTYKWKYEHGTKVSGSGVAGNNTTPGLICTLGYVAAAGRDPDFFELLKASIGVGCLAKPGTILSATTTAGQQGPATSPWGYQAEKDSSVDAAIIQLGANIIDAFDTDSYSTRILFDDGTWGSIQEYRGAEDLPYLYRMRGSHLKVTDSSPVENQTIQAQSGGVTGYTTSTTGTGTFFQTPEIFDPYNWNPSASVSTLRPTSFRMIPLSADPVNINAGNKSNLGTTQALAHSRNNGVNKDDAAADPGEPTLGSINGEVISFTVPATSTGLSFFREATLLNKPDPTGGAASDAGPPRGSLVTSSGADSAGYSPIPITSWYKASAYVSSGVPSSYSSTTDNQKYLGFTFGTVPLWFPLTATTTVTATTPMVMTGAYNFSGNTYFTYQVQYLSPNASDPANTYVTYDEKFLPLSFSPPSGGGGGLNQDVNTFLSGAQNATAWTTSGASGNPGGDSVHFDLISNDNSATILDPRTARFSTLVFNSSQISGALNPPPLGWNGSAWSWNQWVDASQNALMCARPDFNVGWDVLNPSTALKFYNPSTITVTGNTQTGFTGMLSQNAITANYSSNTGLSAVNTQSTGPSSAQYYADPDGVVRRASGGYSAAPNTPFSTATGIAMTGYNGLPMQTGTSFSSGAAAPLTYSSRPIMLNRPFRSVADLGYVFSGTPWRNIDFSTPESGYAPLLDVFCVNDTEDPNGLVAGKVNLNTRQAPVLEAILSGAYKDEFASGSTILSSSDAQNLITTATYGLTSRTASTTSGYGPLTNLSELVGRWVNSSTPATPIDGTLASNYSGFSGDLSQITLGANSASNFMVVPRFREAAVRALSNCGQTRVWNLMIDVIAQTGHFPSTSTGLNNFLVEGEQRYWVHLAIDRYTGQVLDQQIEVVKE